VACSGKGAGPGAEAPGRRRKKGGREKKERKKGEKENREKEKEEKREKGFRGIRRNPRKN
jgi:ribosomal protein L12E/L44/L45/RPP1/RPP2